MFGRTAKIYGTLFCHSFFKRRSIPPAQRRSIPFCVAFFTVFPLFEGLTRLCLAVDHVLFPQFRRNQLPGPVFIVGNPRSGTTILHRVMSRDPQFFYFKSWEIFFPSLLQKTVLDFLGWCDGKIGRPFERLVAAREARQFQSLNRMHEFGLFLPEEDDKLLVHMLATIDSAFLFPYGPFERHGRFDEEVGPDEQNDIMRFYAAGVQRQGWLRGPNRRLLSKNPWFTGKVETLLKYFPDARLIYLVRNPLDVVPSAISLARSLIVSAFGKPPGDDLDEQTFQVIKWYYLQTPAKLQHWPANRCMTVDYRDLVKQPHETITRIYQQLELPVGPEFAVALREEADRMRQHKSSHKYGLETTAISPERIVRELRPIFDQYGFDTRQEADFVHGTRGASDLPLNNPAGPTSRIPP